MSGRSRIPYFWYIFANSPVAAYPDFGLGSSAVFRGFLCFLLNRPSFRKPRSMRLGVRSASVHNGSTLCITDRPSLLNLQLYRMKRSTKLLIGGFTFLTFAGFALAMYFYLFYPYQNGYAARIQKTAIEKNGTSCHQVKRKAIQFANDEMAELVAMGRQSKDWVREGYTRYAAEVRWLRDATFQCVLIRNTLNPVEARSLDGMDKFAELYSTLDTFITKWGAEPPTASGLKPEAFVRLELLHRDITSRSTPTR